MENKSRIFRSAEERVELLEAWKASGLPADEFAVSRGVKPKTFSWWRWQLKNGKKKPPPSSPATRRPKRSRRSRRVGNPKLVRVEVGGLMKSDAHVAWELETPLGLTLRVRGGIAKDELEHILHIMVAKGIAT